MRAVSAVREVGHSGWGSVGLGGQWGFNGVRTHTLPRNTMSGSLGLVGEGCRNTVPVGQWRYRKGQQVGRCRCVVHVWQAGMNPRGNVYPPWLPGRTSPINTQVVVVWECSAVCRNRTTWVRGTNVPLPSNEHTLRIGSSFFFFTGGVIVGFERTVRAVRSGSGGNRPGLAAGVQQFIALVCSIRRGTRRQAGAVTGT